MLYPPPHLTFALLLALSAAARPSAALPAAALAHEQAAAIRRGVQATLDAYRENAAAARWEPLLALYADEPAFRWAASGRVEARSVADIRKSYLALPAGSRVETTFEDAEITPIAQGVATVETRFETHLVDPQGGGFRFGGVLTLTLVERADGWKILNGHSSGGERR